MSISTSPAFVPVTMKAFREKALPLFANGKYKAMVDTVLPLEELERSHEMINERQHFGKVVLKISH